MARAVGLHSVSQSTTSLAWLCLALFLNSTCASAAPSYQPRLWNRSCNYTVSNIPAIVFFNRSKSTADALFPVSPGYRMQVPDELKSHLASAQLSCFGPGQRINQTLVAAGLKMPCQYAVKPDGTVDYWEETVCELTLRSNCYCYALNKQSNSGYCIPGFTSLGSMNVDYSGCADAIRKVQLDGGKLVTRQQVYAANQPDKGHYIALVIWPNNDFHFFRRDAEGWWSQKRGDTFVTNTYPNGSVVLDVEDPGILGAYKQFCGYFYIDPDTHATTDSAWTYSSVPKRLQQARSMGYVVETRPLRQPSTGWMRLNYPYLLFGLDAAVFESGDRRLPWQERKTSPVQHEAGSRTAAGKARFTGSNVSSSLIKPHWVSHAQYWTTVQERDRTTREQYERLITRSPST